MSYFGSTDYLIEVAKGLIPGHSLVHKFGATVLDTSIHPVTTSTFYRTPTSAVSLEFVSDDAADTAAGLGAQEITIQGLGADWTEVTQTIETNGTTAVAITTALTRLYRWYVSRSGTYATETAGSHQGNMTIRVAGGGDTWDDILISPFPLGQSEIGVYTVPKGKTGYLLSKNVFTDSSKESNIYLFQRPLTDDVVTPFTGTMRMIEREISVAGGLSPTTRSPKGPFIGPCDMGFMGAVSVGTAEVSVEMEILLVDD